MYDTDDDILNEADMLAICQGLDSTQQETTALGQEVMAHAQHLWRQDVIEMDRQLKALATAEAWLDHQRLILPDGYGSTIVALAPDALLDTLTTLFTVLMTLFHETEIGQYYRPSPYATRFLWAFKDCAYLREAGFHQPPTMNWSIAEQTVIELNKRLTAWYQSLKQPDFTYECSRNRRNSRNNYQRLCELTSALFDRYRDLTIVYVELGYTEMDAPYIDYATARHHREKLCRMFHQHDLFTPMVGYAWKLEWQPRKGFYYQLLLFFDANQAGDDVTLAHRLGEYWVDAITGRQGRYRGFNHHAERVYYYNALGRIDYYDYEKQRGLDYISRYLTKIDEYASMLVTGRTFQTSQTPSPVDDPCRNRSHSFPAPWSVGDIDFPGI